MEHSGFEPRLATLGQVRNSRLPSLNVRQAPLLTMLPLRFRLRRTAHWADASLVCPVDVFTSRLRWFGSDYHRHNKNPPTRGGFLLCGDSWTRTNDPIDVNDVLYRLSHATGTEGIIHEGGGMVKAFFRTANRENACQIRSTVWKTLV